MKLVVVRHAESNANVSLAEHEKTKNEDIEITEKGIEQAQKARDVIFEMLGPSHVWSPYIVWTSLYKRSIQTANIIAKSFSHKIIKKEMLLTEQCYGSATGFQSTRDFFGRDESLLKHLDRVGDNFMRLPYGESKLDVALRAETFLNKTRLMVPYRNVHIVVGHKIFCEMLHAQITGEYDAIPPWENCQIRQYDIGEPEPSPEPDTIGVFG